MTQMGMAVFGNNPSEYHGTCRNPVNPNHYPGASSSGTAAAITSGMVPFGIGTDGGGSIRMPSSQCGIVGLKPTFARCPTHGKLKGGCRGNLQFSITRLYNMAIWTTIISYGHYETI